MLLGGEAGAASAAHGMPGADSTGGVQDGLGLALVFAIDAVSFIVPLLILLVIRIAFRRMWW